MKQLFGFLTLALMTQSIFGQDWLDKDMYPFEHNYLSLESGRMHYVDKGNGSTLLFVHGTPTWSFLYRKFIEELSKDYRCIAPDHIGFGLSEKPVEFSGTPEQHAKNLIAFIEALDLQHITLIVHDFGGPIGLAAALDMNDRIDRIVMFNTWLWATKSNPAAQKIDRILNSSMGKFMYLRMNFSPKVLLKQGFFDRKKLTKSIHKQYIYPFPTKDSRWALLNIGQSLVGSSDWYQQQWELLEKLESKPWLILWGMEDTFITSDYLDKWLDRLPNAHVKELNCGHFVQEEKSKESIEAIRSFLE